MDAARETTIARRIAAARTAAGAMAMHGVDGTTVLAAQRRG